MADTQTHADELVLVTRQEVWSAQGWGWDGGVELSCSNWKSPCVLEEGVPKDERPRGFLERKAVGGGEGVPLRREVRSRALRRRDSEREHLSRVPSARQQAPGERVAPG